MRRPGRKFATALAAGLVAVTVTGSVAQVPVDLSSLGVGLGMRDVCADFTDAIGLYEGNNVAMLGVTVGKVARIEQQERSVRVTMSIPKSLDLPADVGATTVSTSIVTDRRVEFTKPYTGGPKYDGRACITKTRTPKGISDVLDGMNRTASEVLGTANGGSGEGTRALAEFVANADDLIRGSGNQANLALAALSKIIGDPVEKDAMARSLVENSADLTSMFVTNWPDFEAVLARLSSIAQLIQGSTNGLGTAVAYANDFLPVVARNIAKYDDQVYGLADKLVPYAHEILSRVGDTKALLAYLPALFRDAPGLFDPVRNALLVTYRSPKFEVSVGGQKRQMNLADLLATSRGGVR